jgi:transketolase
LGYFAKSELKNFNNGGMLGEHPDFNIPGIEVNSGSLGHGLGIGSGMALAAKLNGNSHKTFVLLGDGECNEGSIWEAAMFSSHHNLDNLTAIIDRNGLCIHGTTEEINHLEPLSKKFISFGWHVESIDGHNINKIISKISTLPNGKPKMIIANTVKGKGVSFMENDPKWHHGEISNNLYEKAKKELKNNYKND